MAYNPNTNITAFNGNAALTGNGITGTGSPRVTIASDNTPFPTKTDLTTPGTTNGVSLSHVGATAVATGNGVVSAGVQRVAIASDNSAIPINGAQWNGNAVLTGNGVTGTGSQRVTIASDNTPFPVKLDQTTPGTTNAFALAQVGANTVLTGNGVTGTGSQRVTIASDNTPFPVKIDQTTPGSTNAVVQTPATPTPFTVNSAATTNATSVKNAAGTLYGVCCSNAGAAAAFIKLYNKASAPTVGTDVPVLTIPIPASSVVSLNLGELGHRFATGIALAITNLVADSDATAVAANQVKVMGDYI